MARPNPPPGGDGGTPHDDGRSSPSQRSPVKVSTDSIAGGQDTARGHMDMSALPEPMRARLAAKTAMSPTQVLQEFLAGNVAGFSLEELRGNLTMVAQGSTRVPERALAAIDAVLAAPPPTGELLHLVSWYANRSLSDKSDAGAAVFLREIADVLRDVINEAPSQR